jgi:hypothetical protein
MRKIAMWIRGETTLRSYVVAWGEVACWAPAVDAAVRLEAPGPRPEGDVNEIARAQPPVSSPLGPV